MVFSCVILTNDMSFINLCLQNNRVLYEQTSFIYCQGNLKHIQSYYSVDFCKWHISTTSNNLQKSINYHGIKITITITIDILFFYQTISESQLIWATVINQQSWNQSIRLSYKIKKTVILLILWFPPTTNQKWFFFLLNFLFLCDL